MKLDATRMNLRLAHPFQTAAGRRFEKQTILVRLEHEGIVGYGEAVPVDFYGQTLESAEAALRVMADGLGDDPTRVDAIVRRLLEHHDDQRAAVAAVDGALHDWLGKRLGVPTGRCLGLDPADAPPTSYSIGIDDPDQTRRLVEQAADLPILKLKVGGPHDLTNLGLIRQIAPDKRIRVDANGAWTADEALAMLPRLAEYGVELVEQPVRRDDLPGLRALTEARISPIVADEACVRPRDIVRLAGCVNGINIKISKCGGIRESLRMIHLAQGLGMRVMLGCMIESSLGIATALLLAPLVDWLDLDAHLLLVEDPFEGLTGSDGRVLPSGAPGLGVCLRGNRRPVGG